MGILALCATGAAAMCAGTAGPASGGGGACGAGAGAACAAGAGGGGAGGGLTFASAIVDELLQVLGGVASGLLLEVFGRFLLLVHQCGIYRRAE